MIAVQLWNLLTIENLFNYRIGLCGFDNPMRDSKTAELRRHIGQVRVTDNYY